MVVKISSTLPYPIFSTFKQINQAIDSELFVNGSIQLNPFPAQMMCNWRCFYLFVQFLQFRFISTYQFQTQSFSALYNCLSLPRAVHLITRVSKPGSRTGFRKISMSRPLLLSVNLLDTREGLRHCYPCLRNASADSRLVSAAIRCYDATELLKVINLFNLPTEYIDRNISSVFGVNYNIFSFLDRNFQLSQSKGFCHLILRLGSICLIVRDQSQIISVRNLSFLSLVLFRRKSKRMINNSGPKMHPCRTPSSLRRCYSYQNCRWVCCGGLHSN